MANLYQVSPIEGKGLGIVAKQPIKRGALIFKGDFVEEWNEITPQIHIRKFEELTA